MARKRQHVKPTFGGGSPVSKCQVCERNTCDTGQSVDHLCQQCYDIADIDNLANDYGYRPGMPEYDDVRKECDRLLAAAVKLGSNGQRIKQSNTHIWCLKSDCEPEPLQITEVFRLSDGAWRVIVDGAVVPAEFNSKGAAEAAIPVERARRELKAR